MRRSAQDEYDSYLGDVLGLLERHVSPDEIADYLHQVETASMGLVDGDGKALVPDERRGTVVSELQRMFHREMLEG